MIETIYTQTDITGDYRITQYYSGKDLTFHTLFTSANPKLYGESEGLYQGQDRNEAHDAIIYDIIKRNPIKKRKTEQLKLTFE